MLVHTRQRLVVEDTSAWFVAEDDIWQEGSDLVDTAFWGSVDVNKSPTECVEVVDGVGPWPFRDYNNVCHIDELALSRPLEKYHKFVTREYLTEQFMVTFVTAFVIICVNIFFQAQLWHNWKSYNAFTISTDHNMILIKALCTFPNIVLNKYFISNLWWPCEWVCAIPATFLNFVALSTESLQNITMTS